MDLVEKVDSADLDWDSIQKMAGLISDAYLKESML